MAYVTSGEARTKGVLSQLMFSLDVYRWDVGFVSQDTNSSTAATNTRTATSDPTR